MVRPNAPLRPQDSAGARELDGHGAKSAAVREKAILALLTQKSIGRAAAKSGVNEKTLRRWLTEDTAFQTAYAAARQAAFETAMNRIQALAVRAIETLEDLLGDTEHPNVRLGAARTVTELAIHQHDANTILKTLEALEQRTGKV